MTHTSHTVETLKSEGYLFAAGALAFAMKYPRVYGCHYGMRSDRDRDAIVFFAGYDAAERNAK